MRVLVTFGSKRGGTEGIATIIAERLRASGLQVVLTAAGAAVNASAFDAVVVGGALYMMRWHPDARGFVRHNAAALTRKPVWFFSSGPLDDSAERKHIPPVGQVQRLMNLVGAQGHMTFGGRLEPDAKGFMARSLAAKSPGDFRDRVHIEDWADQVAGAARAWHDLPAASRPRTALPPISTAATWLSWAALLGATVASLVTLLWSGSFPAPPGAGPSTALAEARGWSAVTLVFAVIPGLLALATARAGSLRGRLIWAGIMAYLVYTYLELAVSPPFSALYLIYVATFACAIPAALLAASSVDPAAVARALSGRLPRRLAAGFALAYPLVLGLAWLRGIVGRTVAGDFGWPQGDAAIGHVVHALDLGLLVPLGVAAGVLVLRRRPVGHVLMAICLVFAVCMSAALVAMVGVSAVGAGNSVLTAAPFAVLWLLATGVAISFFSAGLPQSPRQDSGQAQALRPLPR